MRIRSFTAGLLLTVAATPVLACAFHGYSPQPTFVEKLLGSDNIVLARSSPDNPFRFDQITALEGDGTYVELPHLVDSATRRKFDANPDDMVLFARDGSYGPWQRLAYIDADMLPVLETVMAELPVWEIGADEERFALFASLLEHPSDRIHRLALLELDMADYGILRRLDLKIDLDRLLAQFDAPTDYNLRPIRVLLSGFSKAPEVATDLRDRITLYANSGSTLLGARATALIQHSGIEAARWLVDTHLADRSLPVESRELLTEALAIHSVTGDAELRGAVQAMVSDAITADPSLAPLVARQFGARADWSQTDVLSSVIRSGAVRAPLDMLLLTQYTAIAAEAAGTSRN